LPYKYTSILLLLVLEHEGDRVAHILDQPSPLQHQGF